ncbi:MAG: tetratricopeptide repeat protein [Candidatus Sulfotelmatobacter sp.]
MRGLMWRMIVVAVVVGLPQYGFGTCEPEQATRDMKSMSVAELEEAGDACRGQKDYEQAIQYLREALRKDRKNAVLYNKLGMAELTSGDRQSARADFERAAKVNKKYADALNNEGAVYFVENNFSQAAKYFQKAVALEETRAPFHVNLGAAWFSQKKLDRAMNQYARALELDPKALEQNARVGITAQVSSPEERAKFYYLLAKIQAKRGDVLECLACLKKAKDNGYRNLAKVYKEEEFSRLWNDPRLAEIVPPPAAK